MRAKEYPDQLRLALQQSISRAATNLNVCVKIPEKDFSRKRKLPLKIMLFLLIANGSGSLAKELYDWFGYKPDTATASAFVQQRDKIRPEAMEMIFKDFSSHTTPNKTFRGYRLFAVDGSDLRLPSNPSDEFSAISNSEGQKHYNLVHLNAMYDLINKVYIDVEMQGKKGMNEHRALVSMVDRSTVAGQVLVLMDRGYESFNNIAHFQEKQWNFIIRAKESYGMITKLVLPETDEFDVDHTLTIMRRQTKETLAMLESNPERYRWIQPHTTFDYIKHKQSNMYDLRFRAVRFLLADGIYETVYTNLDRETFPVEAIKELYNRRWGIETSFRDLKYAIGLSALHSRKKNSMLQEVFSRLILYNFSSLIAQKVPSPSGKQVCFSLTVVFIRQFLKKTLTSSQLLEMLSKHLLPVRPGRQFKRYQNPISAVAFQYRTA